MHAQVGYLWDHLTPPLLESSIPLCERHTLFSPAWHTWSSNRCNCMFVSSQVDLLLLHPHFLLIVPLYVLLGRCSVILSRAGCLYDPRTEIWLARPECLSFFPFPPLPFASSAQVFTVTVHPSIPSSAAFCMPASPSAPHSRMKQVQEQPQLTLLFFHVKPHVSSKPPPFYFGISGHCLGQVCLVLSLMQ